MKLRAQIRPLKILAISAAAVAVVAYLAVIAIFYSLPHLPLANKRTFYALLRAQMAVDASNELQRQSRGMVLFLGSSVVERGVSERYMDSEFNRDGVNYQTMNAGTGGFCAEANLPLFRAMLDQGLKPAYVVYGVCLQELNAASNVHAFLGTDDTASVKLKAKTVWNVIRYGPTALCPLFDAAHLHQYVFAANNAFRDVPNLTLFDKLMFGENMFSKDSAYKFEPKYLEDLREIAKLCKTRGIRFALYNAPLQPKETARTDIPFVHRTESYQAILTMAKEENIPLWNFDHRGLFTATEFQDSYHLTPIGAKKISGMLADSISRWSSGGGCIQDGIETLD